MLISLKGNNFHLPKWLLRWLKYFVLPLPIDTVINTLRPRQNGRHLPEDIFKCIFLNENVWTLHKISLKFVPKGRINNIPALVQIMAWCRPGDKPLSEPMMVNLLTHICVTRPQWVKNGKNTWLVFYSPFQTFIWEIVVERHLSVETECCCP